MTAWPNELSGTATHVVQVLQPPPGACCTVVATDFVVANISEVDGAGVVDVRTMVVSATVFVVAGALVAVVCNAGVVGGCVLVLLWEIVVVAACGVVAGTDVGFVDGGATVVAGIVDVLVWANVVIAGGMVVVGAEVGFVVGLGVTVVAAVEGATAHVQSERSLHGHHVCAPIEQGAQSLSATACLFGFSPTTHVVQVRQLPAAECTSVPR